MSKSESEPEFLNFDVQLWRRDIQTFADTTRLALEAIVDELSNQCSGGGPVVTKRKPVLKAPVKRSERDKDIEKQKPTTKVGNPTAESASESAGAEKSRLTDLKAKLAERLARK